MKSNRGGERIFPFYSSNLDWDKLLIGFRSSVRDTGAVQLIYLYASTVTREGAGSHGWPAGMCFFAPAPRVFVCLSRQRCTSCVMCWSLLTVQFLTSWGPCEGSWALVQGSGVGVLVWNTPCALSGILFLFLPQAAAARE